MVDVQHLQVEDSTSSGVWLCKVNPETCFEAMWTSRPNPSQINDLWCGPLWFWSGFAFLCWLTVLPKWCSEHEGRRGPHAPGWRIDQPDNRQGPWVTPESWRQNTSARVVLCRSMDPTVSKGVHRTGFICSDLFTFQKQMEAGVRAGSQVWDHG